MVSQYYSEINSLNHITVLIQAISHFLKMKTMSYFFGRFLVNQITTGKKGTVVWLLVGMFGGSISLDCFGGFLDQITNRKKGTVAWPSVAMLDCFGGFLAMFCGGFLDQITNYDRKKRCSCLAFLHHLQHT